MASIITLMDLTISAPDHTTISRRAVTLPVIQAASVPHGPLHLLIDSSGLQVYGAGQWLEAKHGAKSRACQTRAARPRREACGTAAKYDTCHGSVTLSDLSGAFSGSSGFLFGSCSS